MKIVSMMNASYVRLAQNFVEHARRAGVSVRDLRFYCLDADSGNAMGKLGADVIIHGVGQYPKDIPEPWTKMWMAMSFVKLEVMTRELKRGQPFLYMDADIVIHIDPREYVGQITGVDAVCQAWIPRESGVVHKICAGMMALWPTDAARRLVAPDWSMVFESDQHLINHRVTRDHTIKWLALPIPNFPDGFYPWRGEHKRYVTHYNCNSFADKEPEMKRYGDWLV